MNENAGYEWTKDIGMGTAELWSAEGEEWVTEETDTIISEEHNLENNIEEPILQEHIQTESKPDINSEIKTSVYKASDSEVEQAWKEGQTDTNSEIKTSNNPL